MSDTDTKPPEPRQGGGWLEPGANNVQLVYILYIVGFFIGVSALVGIVIAHINSGKAGGWVETHYTWAIRTFWIGLLYSIVCTVLMVVGIGFLLFLLVAVWVVVRCVMGLMAVSRGEPIKNPQSWII